ncbi:MAG: polysaccharide biosynthesis C-terminal domain-containing protein [Bacteroidetes bacterium]|nr:polysaccharide biosynthesis C-terminal domain-containing protein [Bacteroidota bacterium]
MQIIRSIFQNTFFSIVANLLNRISNTLLFIFIIQKISVGDAGIYDLGISYFFISSRLALLGLGHLLIRDVAAERERADKYISSFLLARILLATLAIAISISFIFLTSYDPTTKLIVTIMLIGVFPENINELCLGIYVAYEEVHFNSISVVTNAAIKLGLGLVLVYQGYGLIAIAGIILTGHLCAMVINLLIIHRRYVTEWKYPDISFLKEQLPIALPFIIISTFYILDNRLDKVLLSFLSNEEAIGLYAAATTVILGISLVSDAYRDAVLPIMSRYRYHDISKLHSLYSHSYKLLLVIGIAFVIEIFLTGDDILYLLYQKDLPTAVLALQVMSFSIVFTFINALSTRLLLVYDKHRLTARFMLVTAVINIIVVIILIPQIGVLGAAIGTTLAAVLRFLLLNREAFKLIPRTNQTAFNWRLLLTSTLMAAVIWKLDSWGFLLQSIIGIATYTIALFLSGAISAEERNLLANIARQTYIKLTSLHSQTKSL